MDTLTKEAKNTAIVAYLTIIGAVVAIFMNQDENRNEFASPIINFFLKKAKSKNMK